MGSFEDRKVTGSIFNIQKYSVHDGPGIRTIVFLKGCPLKCEWCSNPESQNSQPELAYNVGRCLTTAKCKRCLEACPKGAITPDAEGTLLIDRSKCGDCPQLCAEACPSQGLIVYGENKTVDEVLKTVEQDAIFYARSGGGMTLSGGEPLMHKDFALALLREAKVRRIKTAIETCGLVSWDTLKEAIPLLNTMLFDIKHMDSEIHKKMTGVGNEIILENLQKAMQEFPNFPIHVRTPVIPGFNNTQKNTRAIAEFIAPYPQVDYEMLPYHRLGTQKYTFLDRTCNMGKVRLNPKITPKLQQIADTIIAEARQ